jgi:hypothetical protein
MRPEDVAECFAAAGHGPEEALVAGFEMSEQCFSLIGDTGSVDAMFGLTPIGNRLAAMVWMLCSNDTLRSARTILTQTSWYLDHFHRRYPILFNYVDARNKLHLKWVQRSGFIVLQKHDSFGFEGRPFYEIARLRTHV